MVRKQEHMLKFYLIFSIYFLINILFGDNSMFYDTETDPAIVNESDENYRETTYYVINTTGFRSIL